jgi:crossover junction endodeoxyribonuclease RuvC
VSTRDIKVLGVDTSLRSSGVGVVVAKGSKLVALEHGAIRTTQAARLSECLKKLHDGILEIIDRTEPEAVAIEGIFFCKNVKTAVILGEARGAVIAACASRGLPIYEYEPRRVKQAVVGHGSAEKEQVRKMVMTLLNLSEEPQEDAGDALAIAVCHIHSRTGIQALMPEQI